MTTKTSLVLVVGAGASKEAGLPTGAELKQQIAQVLDIRFERGSMVSGDHQIVEAFHLDARRNGGDINPYLKASWMIREAMPQAPSIDNFIDAHRSDAKIAKSGKLAIARCILKAETHSLMYVDPSSLYNKLDFKRVEATWYNLFFRLLIDNCQLQDIAGRLSGMAIITFNYDRCIENHLHQALVNYYNIDNEQATALLSSLRIFHTYGSLGSLPTTNKIGSPATVNFGATLNASQLLTVASELKTFTEGIDETHSDIIKIREVLCSATKVAFLGFSFNQQNLDLLYGAAGQEVTMQHVPIFATGRGLSKADIEFITEELCRRANYLPKNIQIRHDFTCANLFQEYGRSLAIR